MTRVRNGRPSAQQLTLEQLLELIIGPGWIPDDPDQTPVSSFESDEDRHAAWLTVRERYLADYDEPWAAKLYESSGEDSDITPS